MLTHAHVQGYKALRDIDTSLEPLTVIVGPNGCGKTSVLESLALVRDFILNPEQASKDHPWKELHWKGSPASPTMTIAAQARPSRTDEERLRRASQGVLSPQEMERVADDFLRTIRPPDEALSRPIVHLDDKPSGEVETSKNRHDRHELRIALELGNERHLRNIKAGLVPHPANTDLEREIITSWASQIRLLRLDAAALAEPSYTSELVPRIGDNGSGLASVLLTLAGEHREKLDEIQEQLRKFVPEIVRIRLRTASVSVTEFREIPVGLDEEGEEIYAKRQYRRDVIGNQILFDYRHAEGVPAKHASEGTLLLLGLLTVVIAGNVSVLLLDDIDRAIHPKAQQQLVGFLRGITANDLQIIATTHSPYLVLHLEYEEVRAMMMSDSGGALIGKLTDHPEYERWRENMTPSEFWTVFGEEWLAKAKARAEGNG